MNIESTRADELDRHWKRKALTGEPDVTVRVTPIDLITPDDEAQKPSSGS